jgi:hypothetical protein
VAMETNTAIIDILEAEAKRMITEKTRYQGRDLEHYFSGREAGILFALDHLKNLKDS